MRIWVDAQLSPAMAAWIAHNAGVDAVAVRDLQLRDATDREIFLAARREAVVVMTKDRDFVELATQLGVPPQVIWVTSGNTSNARLQAILRETLPRALAMLEAGEAVVELTDG